jgi:SRSO17 transposase
LLPRTESRVACRHYCTGLLLDGERKSLSPIATRVKGSDHQQLQQFVRDSPWEYSGFVARLRSSIRSEANPHYSIGIIDDTTFPKKGKASVGVGHQYCGALGKVANCQSMVSLSGVDPKKQIAMPLAARLYLPKDWIEDKVRLDSARVPESEREFKEKWKIALDLIDECHKEAPFEWILSDSGYGGNKEFLRELDQRNIPFIVQVRTEQTYWALEKDDIESPGDLDLNKEGRPRIHCRPKNIKEKAKSCEAIIKGLFKDPEQIKIVKIKLKSGILKHRYVAKQVFETMRSPILSVGPARWLIGEELEDGTIKIYCASVIEDVSITTIIQIAHERWKIEQNYQHLKEELGLDHYEGRSWMGLHHHFALCFAALGFLTILRLKKK